MDLLALGFILLILAASGGIAFVADGLGKKIGKKRLSVLGLRPKHVASLGTVLMGVAVSALTIGFIAGVSRDAREWLKQGRGLLVQRDELRQSVQLQKAQLGGLNSQIRDNRTQIEQEQVELGKRQRRIVVLDNDLREKDGTLRSTNALLEKTKADLALRQRLLESQRKELMALRHGAEIAQSQEKDAERFLAKTRQTLAEVRGTLKVAQVSLDTARKNITVSNDRANSIATKSQETAIENQRLNSQLEEEVKDRKRLVDSLKTEATGRVAQRDEAEAQANDAQARYAAIRKDLDKAEQDLVQQQAAFQNVLNSGFRTSRTEAMTYRRGEEVARIVVPAESNVETTRNALASLLRAARIDATDRGAKSRRAGGRTFEAADIVDRRDPQNGEVADADTLKRALVANLAGRTEDQVLVATSSLNAFAGEPVSLDLMAMPNPVVYRRNDTIDETRIDGTQTEDRILAQLSAFVNGPLRQKAQRDRMIPRSGSPAPYGEPSAANVWSVLQSVRRSGRTVRVLAVAEDDIRAADPLRLELRVH